ncbi:MAG: STAS domain-containing protein [bacterium]|jgi:anti-anti-sigma factor
MPDLPTQKKTTLVEIDVRETLLYVKLVGPQVGQRESPIISQEVEPYLRSAGKGMRHFIIDLQSVTFMSSMGLGVCIALRHKAAAAGAKPILFGTSKELLQLFTMMKIDQLYKFAKDQAELDSLLK